MEVGCDIGGVAGSEDDGLDRVFAWRLIPERIATGRTDARLSLRGASTRRSLNKAAWDHTNHGG